MKIDEDIARILDESRETHVQILRDAYEASIVSLEHFQDWALKEFSLHSKNSGFFEVEGPELSEQPAFLKTYSDYDSIEKGPKNVYSLINSEQEDGIMFFAHADKVPVTYEWGKEIPHMSEDGDRFTGPGISDDVAGIAAMISALKIYNELGCKAEKKILLASVLGKQGGVFGSYGLMRKFGPYSAAAYLHPAESGGGLGELKIASNGLLEFHFNIQGKLPDSTEVHQTIFSKSAVSALDKAISVYLKLKMWAEEQNKLYSHAAIEEMAGQTVGLSVGEFQTGDDSELFQIPLSCTFAGTLCFPPNANLLEMKTNFEKEVEAIIAADGWLAQGNCEMEIGDRVADSSETDINSPFVKSTSELVEAYTGSKPEYFYGHSMSDIRYPQQFWNADSYGIGPLSGDLGKKTEWVDKDEYFKSILIMVELMR